MSFDQHISMTGVSKNYEVSPKASSFFATLFGREHALSNPSNFPKWALKNINLSIKAGEAVGIFGRNGAGKSTLLGLLSGTLDPTSGSIVRSGRIAPLLQLTAWIDQNLTGRQNIDTFCALFSVTGARRRIILEQAQDFADIGKFFDAPCRTYSSGMIARLAFAAALHAPSDFLVIDEVLAVGDMAFREKCNKLLREKVAEGCSLIIVSQNPTAVMTLVSRGIVLEKGEIAYDGPILGASDEYSAILERSRKKQDQIKSLSSPQMQPTSVDLKTEGDFYRMRVTLLNQPKDANIELKASLYHHRGILISEFELSCESDGLGKVDVDINIEKRLVHGTYVLSVERLSNNVDKEQLLRAFRFDVVSETGVGGLIDLSMKFEAT
ncbi:MAG: ABC transporter ATP-binding protein [Pseudomonadota bacterium]